jgi:hypothetical protein
MIRIKSIVVATIIIYSVLLGSVCAEPNSPVKFNDVKDSDWFAEAVGKLNVLKIIDGLPGGLFNPKSEVTRGQFAKMLVQAMGYQKVDSISFDDIKPLESGKAHWASVYIETALRNGVILKDEIGSKFYPDVPIKREDMFMMMSRALKLFPSSRSNPFYDLSDTNGMFIKLYEEYLVRGIIDGNRRLFMPKSFTTRAEAAVVIARMLEYKDDPAKFVARMALEERFKNGTQTAEDTAQKRAEEIAKAKADPNYIIKPDIRVLNTLENFAGYDDPADYFDYFAGFIALDNHEDYFKDVQVKVVCTDKNKDLINTGTLLTQPFISYDHVYEVRRDVWEPLSRAYNKEAGGYILRAITRDEEKAVNGKWTKVPDYVKKGEILNFKLYLKRGTNIEAYDIKFKVN